MVNIATRVHLGCKTIDQALRGGLRRGTITELSAESGCGKTQICLQLVANAWRTGAVYICTEEKFASKRLHQLFTRIHESLPPNERLSDLSKYGDNIFVQRVMEVIDLKKCIKVNLKKLLTMKKDVSVVIVDSIAAPFRGNYQQVHSGITRAQDLKEIATALLGCAVKHNIAVICVNQVSSTMSSSNGAASESVPSLGLAWSNMISTRLFIKKINRFAEVDKNEESQMRIVGSDCEFAITNTENVNSSRLQIRQIEVIFAPDLQSGPAVKFVITPSGVIGIDNSEQIH